MDSNEVCALLGDLLAWSAEMGGWDAPVWRRAEALHEALSRAESDEWRPIASVPKDGTDVLLFQPHTTGGIWTDYWDEDAPGGPDWAICSEAEPTHWKPVPPLPVPPSTGEQA